MANIGRWASLGDMARHLARRQEWLPLVEAAQLYRVTPETMLHWVRDQYFRSCLFDQQLWVDRNQLERELCRPPRHPLTR